MALGVYCMDIFAIWGPSLFDIGLVANSRGFGNVVVDMVTRLRTDEFAFGEKPRRRVNSGNQVTGCSPACLPR